MWWQGLGDSLFAMQHLSESQLMRKLHSFATGVVEWLSAFACLLPPHPSSWPTTLDWPLIETRETHYTAASRHAAAANGTTRRGYMRKI